MSDKFVNYLSKSTSQILLDLNQTQTSFLIGIYGIGKTLVLNHLKNQLTTPIIHLNLKDRQPQDNVQVYKLITDQLVQLNLIETKTIPPQTDFDAHYLLQQALKQTSLTLILQDAHNLLHFPDSFWDNLESLRHYHQLQIVVSSQPQLLYSPTPGLTRLTRGKINYLKLLTKNQTIDYLTNQHGSTDSTINNFIYRYSHGHIGTIKFLLNQITLAKPQNFNKHHFNSLTKDHPMLSVWLSKVLDSLDPQARHIIHQAVSGNLTAKIRSTPEFKTLSQLQLFKREQFSFDHYRQFIHPLIQDQTNISKLNLQSGNIFYGPTDISLSLTKLQKQILKTMLQNPESYISYDQIADIIWGNNSSDKYSLQAINQHISRLRSKLTEIGLHQKTIKSIRSRGYKLH